MSPFLVTMYRTTVDGMLHGSPPVGEAHDVVVTDLSGKVVYVFARVPA